MRLRIFNGGRREIATAVAWWRAKSSFAASRLEDELEAKLKQVATLRFRGPPATDVRLAGFRRLLLLETRYFLYYRVNEARGQVEALRLWHMSRHRPPKLRSGARQTASSAAGTPVQCSHALGNHQFSGVTPSFGSYTLP